MTTAHPSPVRPDATSRSPGSGWAVRVGRGLAVVLAGAQGLVGWWLAWALQFFGDQPSRDDYLLSAGFAAATAVLLVVGAVALARLGGRVSAMVALLSGLTLAALATWSAGTAGSASRAGIGSGVVDGVGGALLGPGAWPLEVAILTAVVIQATRPRTGSA